MLKEIRRRILNLLIALDQFLWVLITLGHAAPDETISAGSYRMQQEGKWQGKIAVPVIDFLFLPFEKNHCYKAYLAELRGLQSRRINLR